MKDNDKGNISSVSIEEMQNKTGLPIEIVEDRQALAERFARSVIDVAVSAQKEYKTATVIMPVGPTGQWKLMADIAEKEKVDLSALTIIQMDEYLTPDGTARVPVDDPFSFSGFVRKNFAEAATARCGFLPENWLVPDPKDISRIECEIDKRGGVDVAFAGIGLNGHIAFNEPPSYTESWTDDSFKNSFTRIIKLAETTKATNSIFGTGGNLGRVPDLAVTIGMKQIIEARRVHVYLDWQWQRFVLRRTLLGEVNRFFPASFLQQHNDVRFTITREVAEPHRIEPE